MIRNKMEAGTRKGQGQGWGYKDRTLWQNCSSVPDKVEHLNKTLSLQKCKGEVAFPTSEISVVSSAVSISLPASSHLPWQGCHTNFPNAWKALTTDWAWGLTIPSSYMKGQETSCFFTLSPSVAKPYFWAYTPTPILFTVVQHSHFFLEWNQKPQSGPVSRTKETSF